MDYTEEDINLATALLCVAEVEDQGAVALMIATTQRHCEVAYILAVTLVGGELDHVATIFEWDGEPSEDQSWVIDLVAATVNRDDDKVKELVRWAWRHNNLIQCMGTLTYSTVATLAAESGGAALPSSVCS
jgi:hypothetical protein